MKYVANIYHESGVSADTIGYQLRTEGIIFVKIVRRMDVTIRLGF